MGGLNIEQCSKKLKNLRDHFICELRKKKKSGYTGPLYLTGPILTLLYFLWILFVDVCFVQLIYIVQQKPLKHGGKDNGTLT